MPERGGPKRVESGGGIVCAPARSERSPALDRAVVTAGTLRAGLLRQRSVRAAEQDMTCCEAVLRLFKRCRRIIRQKPECLLVDLRRVKKADTKLIACLVALYQAAEAKSVRLELQPCSVIEDLFIVCRLQGLIERTRPRDA